MIGSELIEKVRLLAEDPSYDSYEEINQAYEEICQITDFYWLKKTQTGLINFKSGVVTYPIELSDMRSFLNIWAFGNPDGNYRWMPLVEVDQLLFEKKSNQYLDSNGNRIESVPQFYKIEGSSPTVMTVTPAPSQDYETKIHYIANVSEIGPSTTPILPAAYHRKLAMLAAGYILETSKDPVKQLRGEKLIMRATQSFENIVRDSERNRTGRLQPGQIDFAM